ncbi:MAG: diguanylate cyclase, partial [Desulfovibrionales bacterium]|nr:diguanylate cyclase [Desulfovibrionales bacterium]
GWVGGTGEALLIENVTTDPRFQSQLLPATGTDVRSVMAVPLKSANVVYGVLEMVGSQHGSPFTADNLQDLKNFTDLMVVILERVYYFQAMKRMAETDLLTGLPNTRTFTRSLEREIEICKRYGTPSSLILMHLGSLRAANEEYGKTRVDSFLRHVATILLEGVRKADLPCRLGSSRFVVIMPCIAKAQALEVSSRLQSRIHLQGELLELPLLKLTLEVRTGTQSDLAPLLDIIKTGKTEDRGFRKLRDVAANFLPLLNEEIQSLDRRQYYRKKVKLAGQFENLDTGDKGEVLVENLSLKGVGFSTLGPNALSKNARIRLRFVLDDSRRSEIDRLVLVRYTRDRYTGSVFTDQKSYEGDLGFYLMR